MSSEELVVLIRRVCEEDDYQAFESIFHFFYKSMCQKSFYYLKSKDLAEDIVSEVFVNLWLNLEIIVRIYPLREPFGKTNTMKYFGLCGFCLLHGVHTLNMLHTSCKSMVRLCFKLNSVVTRLKISHKPEMWVGCGMFSHK